MLPTEEKKNQLCPHPSPTRKTPRQLRRSQNPFSGVPNNKNNNYKTHHNLSHSCPRHGNPNTERGERRWCVYELVHIHVSERDHLVRGGFLSKENRELNAGLTIRQTRPSCRRRGRGGRWRPWWELEVKQNQTTLEPATADEGRREDTIEEKSHVVGR